MTDQSILHERIQHRDDIVQTDTVDAAGGKFYITSKAETLEGLLLFRHEGMFNRLQLWWRLKTLQSCPKILAPVLVWKKFLADRHKLLPFYLPLKETSCR